MENFWTTIHVKWLKWLPLALSVENGDVSMGVQGDFNGILLREGETGSSVCWGLWQYYHKGSLSISD